MKSPNHESIGLVWLRRDLRLADNVALYQAARTCDRVCLAFVIDPQLLAAGRMGAPLVTAFFDALDGLRAGLRELDSDLALLEGSPAQELVGFALRIGATQVFYNEDYEPDAIARDLAVERSLQAAGIAPRRYLDHVYFGADEVTQSDGSPYRIFTPYRRRWLARFASGSRPPVRSESALRGCLLPCSRIGATRAVPAPREFGFETRGVYPRVTEAHARHLLRDFFASDAILRYAVDRDLPEREGGSRLSPHLRAGTIGIRTCVERAVKQIAESPPSAHAGIETWISELIWRDFYQAILKHFPHVAHGPFDPVAEQLPWRTAPRDFAAWCEGRTGYPVVDAAMRQLNATGWMHNRLRMIVASFLAKDLLLDWRLGERYFERTLVDADLAQNNGGWQWAASTGTDAAPYFRIFNPVLQGKRFDPDGAFVRHMLPELAAVPTEFVHQPWTMPPMLQRGLGVEIGVTYPQPIVDHREARERAIAAWQQARSRLEPRRTGAGPKVQRPVKD